MALYPQTTCFYKAVIHEPPSRVSGRTSGLSLKCVNGKLLLTREVQYVRVTYPTDSRPMYRPNVARPSPTVDRNISTDCDPTINRESTDVSTNCWQTIDWQLTLISTDSRLIIGWQLTDIYWPTVDQCISADCRQTIDRKLTKIYRPTAKWLSTDSRPIYRPTADWLSTEWSP